MSSAAANMIDIYRLTGVVRSACYEYDDRAFETPPELDNIIKHLDIVRQTLKKLIKVCKCEDSSGPNQSVTLELLNAPDGIILKYKNELLKLEIGLKRVRQSSETPLEEIDLTETLDNLERIRVPFNTALEEQRYD